MKAQNILETIGHTPLVKINRLFGKEVEVWMKLEKANPGGSIKDRIALSMVDDAEEKGYLNKSTTIIEPTSGNTGIGLSMVAAVKGYRLILVMPESMSVERRRLMAAYGAELVLTPKEKGMGGAIEKAAQLAEEIENSWVPSQFENKANVKVHLDRTAKEIIADMPEGFDYLITGVGTGGHITGVSTALTERFPKLKTIAVEPEGSPVLSGGKPGPHPIQGIGAGFIPKILNTDLIYKVLTVDPADALRMAQRLAKEEGIIAGISTGASLAAIEKKLPEVPHGSRILTFNYDTGERYLSVEGLFPA
ncbi:MAG: cysteine synthase A [Cytophagales bacterium]|nr:cysteine synthase A [Cytophagales bacterium]